MRIKGTTSFSERIKIFCASGICIALFGISMAIPLSMITMGSIYLHDCPAERLIPIYLVVFGVFSTVLGILRFLTDFCKSDDGKASCAVVILYVISLIVGPFLSAWFIAGNVWIYRLHGKYSTEPTDPNYCNNTLYLYAFWLTTSLYILSGVCCVVLIIGTCVILWRKLAATY